MGNNTVETKGLKILLKEDLAEKVCVVVGTRPGIIKMSPLVKELDRRNYDNFLIHTGQHYSPEMDRAFFDDLELKQPLYALEKVKEKHLHGEQTAEMIVGVEKALIQEKPKVILVCGDANTNLAAALAARKLGIAVGHVESGLRSNDWRMPEEHNRIMIDHISEFLFAPSEGTKQNLIEDNVKGKIFVTGNTIVDSVFIHRKLAEKKSTILGELGLEKDGYVLVTSHREENVDHKENLINTLTIFENTSKELNLDVIFPIHPRTRNRLKEFGLEERVASIERLRIIEPRGYLDFLMLQQNAKIILTDSGGIQEESCIMKVPCVTLRENTERPETVEVGSNIVAGLKPENVSLAIKEMLSKPQNWENPFGDGTTAKQIIDVVTKH